MNIYKVRNSSGSDFDVDEDKLHQAEKDGFLPVVSNGKEEHRVSSFDLHKAAADGYSPIITKPEPSIGESIVRGAAQGATFGGVDEATGAINALSDVAGDKYTLADLLDRYRAHRDESRANYAAAEQANPIASLAGNLAGGIALPMGALNSARSAMALGAAAGLGSSEADLTKGEVGQAAHDVGTGAVIGGAAHHLFNLGKGAYELAKATSPATSYAGARKALKDAPIAEILDEKTGQIIKQPVNFHSEKGIQAAEAKFNTHSQEIHSGVKGALKDSGEAISRIKDTKNPNLTQSEMSSDLANVTKTLSELKDNILTVTPETSADQAKLKQTVENINQLIKAEVPLSAKVIANIKSKIDDLQSFSVADSSKLKDREALQAAKKTSEELGEMVKRYVDPNFRDELAAQNKKYSEVSGIAEQLGIEKGPHSTIEEAIEKSSPEKFMSKLDKNSLSGIQSRQLLNEVEKTFQEHGLQGVTKSLKEGTQMYSPLLEARNKGKNLMSIFSTVPTIAGSLHQSVINQLTKSPKEFYKVNADKLRGLTGAYEKTGKALANVMDKMQMSDETTRAALVYGLQQNPQYRELLRQIIPTAITGDNDERP